MASRMVSAGNCYKCGFPVWIPQELYKAARHDGTISFSCAYGHEACYSSRNEKHPYVEGEELGDIVTTDDNKIVPFRSK